jgi:dTDP-4-dehydrorhamnose reductase
MKILLTGTSGQVGYELYQALHEIAEIIVPSRNEMNLANLAQVSEFIRQVKPDLIINPGAYTAVDKAEKEIDLAMTINAHAPAVMAEEARKLGAAIVHYSTDYVFDGSKEGAYVEDDPTSPCNVYGQTKLAGEQAIQASGARHLILRTSWVYSLRGNNFLLTMLRLARERDELRIVADQHGAPTWSRTIASTTARILPEFLASDRTDIQGIYHLTAQKHTTWHGFAKAIFEKAMPYKKLSVIPIASSEYPVPARRPKNSVMSSDKLISKFGALPDWDDALSQCLKDRAQTE